MKPFCMAAFAVSLSGRPMGTARTRSAFVCRSTALVIAVFVPSTFVRTIVVSGPKTVSRVFFVWYLIVASNVAVHVPVVEGARIEPGTTNFGLDG